MVKNSLLSAVVAVVVSLAVMFSVGGRSSAPISTPASFGGVEHTVRENFQAGLSALAPIVDGGSVASITATASIHLTARQVCDNAIIRHNLSLGTASTSNDVLPTAASLISYCLPSIGMSKTIYYENGSDQSGEYITIVANTGDALYAGTAASSSNNRLSGAGPANASKQRALVRFTNIDGASVSVDFRKITK